MRKKFASNHYLLPEEVILDKFLIRKQPKELKLELPLPFKAYLTVIQVGIVGLILIFLAKAFYLQILSNSKYAALAQRNLEKVIYEKPLRGIIYDRNYTQLVENVLTFDLMLNKKELPASFQEREKVVKEIAEILGEDFKNLKTKIAQSLGNKVLIKENLDSLVLLKLKAKIDNLKGFYLQENYSRLYLYPKVLAPILGYIGKVNSEELKKLPNQDPSEFIGKTGIEKSKDQILRGKAGVKVLKLDAFKREIESKVIKKPQPGKSLLLTIDLPLQKKLYQQLEKKVREVKAKGATGIILDAKTGEVLALVSIPSFDLNLFTVKRDPQKIKELFARQDYPLLNRAISALYPPGSTLKPIIALAGLKERIISPQKLIDTSLGYIEIESEVNPKVKYRFYDWKPHGLVDMRKALAVSSNIYFYTIGGGYKNQKGLGPYKIKEYLDLFGWEEKTGIDLPGEKKGFVPSPEWKEKTLKEKWYQGNTYHLSIGQGYLKITPIELAVSTLAIATEGKLFVPRLVKAILDPETKKVLKVIKPKIKRKIDLPTEYFKVVKEGMFLSTQIGSSKMLSRAPVKVGAKTGTAETSKEGVYHHWVTLFAPFENPEIVITLQIEEVEGIRPATLPVALEILNYYFSK